jgi:hypothetical protein
MSILNSIQDVAQRALWNRKLVKLVLPILITLVLFQVASAFYSPRGPANPFASIRSFMTLNQDYPYDFMVYLPLVLRNW